MTLPIHSPRPAPRAPRALRPSFGGAALLALVAGLSVVPHRAMAQDAGTTEVDIATARTKLVDKGEVFSDGVRDPNAAYSTRDTWHGEIGVRHFVHDGIAVEGSLSTPATTDNIPAGSLAGLPNLGDDEFVLATIGASIRPFKGPVRPYVGAGLQVQLTTQERDGLAVGLDIPDAHGPYVQGGASVSLSDRIALFVDGRKAWYHTMATGRLPLDATGTNFANIRAKAVLDPLTLRAGLTVRLGRAGGDDRAAAEADGAPASGDWLVKAGITNLSLADKIDLTVGGQPLAGAGLSTFEHQTVSVQVARFLTDQFAINATVGLPPRIDIKGAGAIGPLPMLGKVRYGPTTLTAQYHPWRRGAIRPYVGAGAAYLIVLDTTDGVFQDLRIENDLGLALEGGVEFAAGERTGLFVDVKKAFLAPVATGTFQGAPVVGRATLDPWALTGGVSFHF